MTESTEQPEFSAAQIRTLSCALDEVIPPSGDGRLPGAGEIVWRALAARSAEIAPFLEPGLAALDTRAREHGADEYASLPQAKRAAVLRKVAETLPAFPSTLFFLACTSYYQDPRIVTALGLEARPPHPQGYELETGDLSGLEQVKARGPLYREC